MKRNVSVERLLAWKLFNWGPEYKTLTNLIPPLSVVRLATQYPELEVGDTFRIGYYVPLFGPNCVWLVNAQGEYNDSWDQGTLLDYFEIVYLSNETDFFGNSRPQLEPLV